MTQHRNKLFRDGNRWCSGEELDRLRREAAEDGPEADERLRRAECRCGMVPTVSTIPKKTPKTAKPLVQIISEVIARHYCQDPSARRYHWVIKLFPPNWRNWRDDPPAYTEILIPRVSYAESRAQVHKVIALLRVALPRETGVIWGVKSYGHFADRSDGLKIAMQPTEQRA